MPFMQLYNKLECLILQELFTLFSYLLVRLKPTGVEHFTVGLAEGKLSSWSYRQTFDNSFNAEDKHSSLFLPHLHRKERKKRFVALATKSLMV